MTGTGAGFNPVSLPWVPQAGGNPGTITNNPIVAAQQENEKSASEIARFGSSDSEIPAWLESLSRKANNGDIAAYEKLIDYYMTKDSEKSARDWTASREDTTYQRLIEDLRKAGVSPYVLSGATGSVSSSTGKSYSGSQMVSQENNRNNQGQNNVRSILSLLGIVVAAMIYAL